MKRKEQWKVYLLLSTLFWTACTSPRLFQNSTITPADLHAFVLQSPQEPKLRAGDKITISIWGHDDLSIGSLNSPFTTAEGTGRWVVLDEEGEVNLPKIGRIKLSDYNLKEAAYFLEQAYADHLQDPVINVRVLNHFITLLGEVKQPGKYKIDSEKMSLVNLLGEAGGLTDYAAFQEIQLLREHEGKMLSMEIDFSTFDALGANNALLQADDIVYIPPKGKKQSEEVLNKAVPIVGILTGLAVFLSVFDNN